MMVMTTATTLTSGMNTGIEVGPAPLDAEYIAVILAQVVEDEFDALFEDGSIEAVAADIVGLWGASEEVVREWERRAEGARGKSVNLQEVVDEDEWEDEESEGSGDDGEEVPQLMSPVVSTRRSAKPEPVVDEDGFTLVPKRR
jgi:pre-rRNA-processing protein TSR2